MADAIETLRHLVQTDIDAVHCYSQAIDRSDDPNVVQMLTAFRADHERHIDDLSLVIQSLGGEAPEHSDVSGRALELVTSMASRLGAASALVAMQTNEIVTNHAYDQALRADLPDEVLSVAIRNGEDEARHLAAIRNSLEARQPATGRILNQAATLQGWGAAAWMNILRSNPLAAGMLGAATAFMVAQGLKPHGRRAAPKSQGAPSPERMTGARTANKSAQQSADVLRKAGDGSAATAAPSADRVIGAKPAKKSAEDSAEVLRDAGSKGDQPSARR